MITARSKPSVIADLKKLLKWSRQYYFERGPGNSDLDSLIDETLKRPGSTLQEVLTRITSKAVLSMTAPRFSRGIRVGLLVSSHPLHTSSADTSSADTSSADTSDNLTISFSFTSDGRPRGRQKDDEPLKR